MAKKIIKIAGVRYVPGMTEYNITPSPHAPEASDHKVRALTDGERVTIKLPRKKGRYKMVNGRVSKGIYDCPCGSCDPEFRILVIRNSA